MQREEFHAEVAEEDAEYAEKTRGMVVAGNWTHFGRGAGGGQYSVNEELCLVHHEP